MNMPAAAATPSASSKLRGLPMGGSLEVLDRSFKNVQSKRPYRDSEEGGLVRRLTDPLGPGLELGAVVLHVVDRGADRAQLQSLDDVGRRGLGQRLDVLAGRVEPGRPPVPRQH